MPAATPRAAVATELILGAVGSVALTVYAGLRVGTPLVLQILFAGWVVTPFVLLRAAVGWTAGKPLVSRALEAIAPVITFISLGIYAATALAGPRPKTAVFVLLPPAAWIVIAAAFATAGVLSRDPRKRA